MALALPSRISKVTVVLAWATLISNIGIILTGGAVRLTASGLGCPEWPRCTPESWTSTAEMGIHGAIEFGNRMLTYVLVIICAAMFLSLVRLIRTHTVLVVFSLVILMGIPFQAIIGGITVLTNLNPWVVALHFILSAALVSIATLMLGRIRLERRYRDHTPGIALAGETRNDTLRGVSTIVLVATWVAVFLGTIVTGTGPHAGDPGSPRHDFSADLVTRFHIVPVYILCAAVIFILIRQRQVSTTPAQRNAGWYVLVVVLAQGAVGYWQHFTGLPIALVWIHMLGSALAVVSATILFDRYHATYRTRGLGVKAHTLETTERSEDYIRT